MVNNGIRMKRLTDTNRWDDPWYDALPLPWKHFWDYICCKCDHAGFWKENYTRASFHCEIEINREVALKYMAGRIKPVEGFGDVLYIPQYDEFQNNWKPNFVKCKLKSYKKYGVPTPSAYRRDGIATVSARGEEEDNIKKEEKKEESKNQKTKERTKTKDKPQKQDEDSLEFQSFWKEYPRKVSKGLARKAFKTALKKDSLDKILYGAKAYALECKQKNTETHFIKHPSTWLNAEAWLDYKYIEEEEVIDELE